MADSEEHLIKPLKSWDIVVAGVALVVAASTLISDFTGYTTLGWAFVIALLFAGVINFLLATSAADLSASIPKTGLLYEYGRAIFRGRPGAFIGVFLGLGFFIMYGFAIAGEISAGAFATQAFFHSAVDVRWFIVGLSLLVILPNVIGVREAAWFSTLLLIAMLGIRWFFGLAGLFGWGGYGDWSAANLVPAGGMPGLFGDSGILVAGLALAFWSFVGIEFACSLAEEVREPRKSMPKGLMIGIVLIFLTSMLMGVGVVGTQPLVDWQALAKTKEACEGSCLQLAIGAKGFGETGYALMAIASFTASLGTASVGLAAMSRMLYAIGRDGLLFGPKVSGFFAHINPRTHTPVNAIVFTGLIYILPALYSSQVVDLIYTAAYVWIIMYICFHLLAIANRMLHPHREFGMGKGYTPFAVLGVVVTVLALYYAFYGVQQDYGIKALYMLAAAAIIGGISLALRDRNHASLDQFADFDADDFPEEAATGAE